MTPSLTTARADLVSILDVGLAGVDAVYDQETNREQTGPCWVTVDLERITPTEQVWAVRIYVQAADSLEAAAHGMDVALESVDDALDAAGLTPSDWQVGFVDEIQSKVARSFLNIPRESF